MLRIALLQLTSHPDNVAANLRKGDEWCRRAAAAGADVALFPESWSTGYQGFDPQKPGEHDAWLARAVARDGDFVQHFARLARELRMAIGITYLERWSGPPRNTLTLFDRSGAEVLTYAKVHLCPWDPPDNACTPGDGFPVATLETANGPVRVGAMICFDREFPESARVLMLNGAELILAPNACELEQDAVVGDVRIAQFRARAFENLVAVAMANYAAPQNDGQSLAYYPDGALIARGGDAEGIVRVELDLARVRAWREAEVGRDAVRRPEKYAAISSTAHPRPLARG